MKMNVHILHTRPMNIPRGLGCHFALTCKMRVNILYTILDTYHSGLRVESFTL